jgi:sporulation protein YlmC with PRC-barrel domain
MTALTRRIAFAVSLGSAACAFAPGGVLRAADQPAPISGSRSSTAAAVGSKDGADAMMGMKARELIGREVVNASGKDIGEIDDIVVDEQESALYAIIGVGGFLGIGATKVAIPFEQLRLGADNVILMSERNESDLKRMSPYRKGQWKSVEPDRMLGAR